VGGQGHLHWWRAVVCLLWLSAVVWCTRPICWPLVGPVCTKRLHEGSIFLASRCGSVIVLSSDSC
jgi:hypothetical protein